MPSGDLSMTVPRAHQKFVLPSVAEQSLPLLLDCMEAAETHRHCLFVMEGIDGSLRLLLLREEDKSAALANASLPIHEHRNLCDLRSKTY